MKEHALLLSSEMVLAYLADRKFVTRRIPGPTNSFVNGKRVSPKKWNALEFDLPNYEIKDNAFWFFSGSTQEWYKVEPIYQPKDLLWFRETWAQVSPKCGEYYYKATESVAEAMKWRPSIHLPKEACRLWAEVTICNCERLADITEEQAVKEGVEPNCSGKESCPSPYCKANGCQTVGEYVHYLRDGDNFPAYSALESFQSLWQSIHGPGSWVASPPVYAINFNPLSTTGRPDTATLPSDPGAWKREND